MSITRKGDESNDGPLSGLQVIEICSAIAGPYAGKLLADNGAHVIKVEPPWGDNFRTRPLHYDTHGSDEFTYRFLMYNTGKDSVSIDLKSEEGTEILWDLIEESDVLFENLTSGTLERLGFSWEEMHERNPELVYCSITGYGEEGPYSELPAYDATIQGVSAWVDLIGDSDVPEKASVLAIDHSTALYAVNGILMALFERLTGGTGQRVDVSMLNAAISFLGHQLAEYTGAQNDDGVEPYYGKQEPGGVYAVDDGYISLNIVAERWESFCKAIDREEFLEEDHEFSDVGGRTRRPQELRAAIEEALAGKTAEEWFERFEEVDPNLAYGPANLVSELPADPHVRDRNLIVQRQHPALGDYFIPRPPLRFSQTPPDLADAPSLGEHTDEVLEALGYSPERIRALRERDVVG